MIEGELVDPRIDFCYVTEVALNPGGKSARVYVAVDSAVKDIAKAEVGYRRRPRSCQGLHPL
jgi:ribosome-binding factor A